MKIGGRVSTQDQNPDAQRDALTAVGCDQIFVDKASGKLARRPGLDKALLSANRAGDQLVVTKLDRLGPTDRWGRMSAEPDLFLQVRLQALSSWWARWCDTCRTVPMSRTVRPASFIAIAA